MPAKTAFLFGVVTAVAALSVIALLVMLAKGGSFATGKTGKTTNTATTNTAGTTAGATVDIADVDLADHPYIGEEDAPAVMAFWSDFQCPFCKRFDQTTLPTLVSQYVDTGKLKIVFKDFAFLGEDSQTAAIAARAVWEASPKNYYPWMKAMYEKQDDENGGWGKKDDIIALTGTVSGIDADKVSKLMDDNKTEYQTAIDADRAEGSQLGVRGTPGFIIGNQLISGAETASVFTAAIDAVLSK